jgi:ubiquinone/menaquinone biosynthesis C-methylase UbiE
VGRRDVQGHYEQLAAEYDEHWVYGPDYVPWMAERIIETLGLTPEHRIADIGSGTGLFAREVAGQLRPRHPILCVDPSEAMLRQLGTPAPPGLAPITASAESVASGRTVLPYRQLDAIWLKESVHHLTDRAGTLLDLSRRLAPRGRLLIVMLPATIEYPLFRAALDRFEELQPNPATIADHLRAAGLETTVTHVEHTLRIDRDRYLGMVRSRYMSLLSVFDDAEIEKGVQEMQAAHPEPVLVFPDRFAFILGQRGEART